MNILISGAGIAGPTLAYWLLHYGLQPTLVETAPTLRSGGYLIDFWGAGFDIADRMGLLPEISRKGYKVQEVRVVNREGKRIAGFPAETFFRAAQGRYVSLPRGDLASTIFEKIGCRAETFFDDSISTIEQNESHVRVTFESGLARDFDLVIGADGLHSRVRELVFGAESQFEKYLGYKVAVFKAPGYTPREDSAYVMYTQIGQQVGRFAMRDGSTMFIFIFADESFDREESNNFQAQKALLRKHFGNSGWECPQILEALMATDDLYFDRVSQIRLDGNSKSWTRGRVSLVGDAAFCVSLLAGQGSALAIVAAHILAGELHRSRGNYRLAFARYQELFGPFVLKKQRAALRFANYFAPKSQFAMFLRNQIMNLMRISWIADFAVGRDIVDKIEIPSYE